MYNRVILLGHLSKNIELRYTQSGHAIANTGMATTRKYKGADGQSKEDVLFIDVSFFGRTAEVANQYLHKGSKVLIEGRLKLEQWTAKDGTKRSKHKVDAEALKMLDSKPQSQPDHPPATSSLPPQRSQPATHQTATPQPSQPTPSFTQMETDEEIPF